MAAATVALPAGIDQTKAVLNTAIDADDGSPILCASALKALAGWRAHLVSITTAGKKRKEIRSGVDPATLASLIISSLEGALVVSPPRTRPQSSASGSQAP